MRGLWTHLERLGRCGIGTRGPGETQIETDRRLARDRIAALQRKLDHVRSSRAVMRAERERAHLPQVALAGYTNAGKSTLLNALTGADGRRRATACSTRSTRRRASLQLTAAPYLLTDTVGFIRKLPHQLVDAFGATLEETRLADLVLHVVDASAPEDDMVEMLRAVDEVLEEIGAGEPPRLLVLNKADLIDDERREELRFAHPDGIARLSAARGEGLDELLERIERRVREHAALDRPAGARSPTAARLAELHELAGDLEREDTPQGVRIRARVPQGRSPRASTATPWREARRPAARPARGRPRARPPRRCRSRSARAGRLRARPGRAGRGSRPGSRSSCRRATRGSCCRARAWPPSTASRSSTRPG